MRAALWVRVSSDDQHTANQIPILKDFAESKGYEVVETYDLTASASNGAINEYRDQMMRDAESDGFDALIVWKVDRLSRAGGDDALSVARQLHRWGVWLHVVEDRLDIDPTKPLDRRDRFGLFLTGDTAEDETETRKARTLLGHQRARAEGKHIGRFKGSGDRCKVCRQPRGDAHRGADHRFKGRKKDGYRLRWQRERLRRMEEAVNKSVE